MAGVGKTHVAAEAVEDARRSRYATAWAGATGSASAIPFGALAQLLPVGLGGGRSADVLRRARDALVEAAGGGRLVLAIDDAHLLDATSAALVHQLVGARDAFVLLTVRTGEAAPDALVELWKDELCLYVELQALSRAETEELLARALEGGVDGATALALWNATRGNPLYLRELVHDGVERGALAQAESGAWRWQGRPTVGGRLAHLIERRLGTLTERERTQLELVAFGEPLEARAAAVVDADLLEALTRRGLVSIDEDDRRMLVRAAHPLYGETVRAGCSPLRRSSIMCELADALAGTGARRRDDLLRLASWRLESGTLSDPDTLTQASARSAQLFDFALAERLARAGVDAGGGWPARHALAEPLRGLGRFEEADELYAALAADAGTDERRALAARDRAANLYWGLGRSEAAREVLQRAETVVADDDERDLLAAERARIAFFSNRPLDALEAVSHILSRPQVRDDVGFRVALAAGPALGITGRTGEALALVERWRRVAIERGLHLLRGGLDLTEIFVLLADGRLDEANAAADAFYAGALAARSHIALVHSTAVRGCAALACGRIRSALSSLDESVTLIREFDPTGNRAWTLALVAQTAAQLGDAARAEAALAEAEAALPDARTINLHDVFLARAWTAAARGELSQAQAHAEAGADWAESRGQRSYVALTLHELVRLGGAAAAAPRLAALAPALEGTLVPVFAAHASGLVAGDAPQLQRAGDAFAGCGALLRAAETFCDAAAAFRLAGRADSARRAAARAHLLTGRCETPRTPALSRAGPAEELTRREYEIALLAASGTSSRVIAERLVVSQRTVENHLQHVYRKLGVHTREELEELLR
jgi:DNA-binding CsgD family transcriptional regulator